LKEKYTEMLRNPTDVDRKGFKRIKKILINNGVDVKFLFNDVKE